jgi:Tfp pilus assembly protein PilF
MNRFRLAVLLILAFFTTATAQRPDQAQRINPLQKAEAFWLLGRVNQQLDEQEAAISAFKTAIFWEPHLIDAHLSLARIFLTRNKRSEAKKYIKLALEIDPANQEALALHKVSR